MIEFLIGVGTGIMLCWCAVIFLSPPKKECDCERTWDEEQCYEHNKWERL